MKIGSVEIALALAGAGAIAWGIARMLARRPRIPARDRVAICEAAANTNVVLCGLAQPASATCEAPISGEACVLYRLEVQHFVHRDDYEAWEQMLDDESRSDFVVSDSTGRAIVRGGVAVLHPPASLPWNAAEDSSRVADFVASRGQSIAQKIRWRECVLRSGDRVRVRGIARRDTSFGRDIVIDAPEEGWIEVERD